MIGVFNVATNGVITFVAGPRQSKITKVSRSGTNSVVQFTTTVGTTYGLAYTNQLGGAVSTWPVDPTTITGDGRSDTIYHTNSATVEFYRVTAQ